MQCSAYKMNANLSELPEKLLHIQYNEIRVKKCMYQSTYGQNYKDYKDGSPAQYGLSFREGSVVGNGRHDRYDANIVYQF